MGLLVLFLVDLHRENGSGTNRSFEEIINGLQLSYLSMVTLCVFWGELFSKTIIKQELQINQIEPSTIGILLLSLPAGLGSFINYIIQAEYVDLQNSSKEKCATLSAITIMVTGGIVCFLRFKLSLY